MDSFTSLYKSRKIKDSLYLDFIFKKSNLHFSLNEKDSSFYYDHLLLKESKPIDNLYYEARANRNLGFFYSDEEKYDSAFYHLSQAKNIFDQINDTLQVAMRLQNLAILKSEQSDFFGSNKLIVEQLKYLNKFDSINVPRAFNRLALNYKNLKKYDEALKYHKLGISMASDSSDRLSYLNNLSILYQKQNNFHDAINLQEKLLAIAKHNKNERRVALLSNSLAFSKMEVGQVNVLALLNTSIELKRNLKMSRKLIPSYLNFGKYHLIKGDSIVALKYLDSARNKARELNVPKTELTALGEIIKVNKENLSARDRYIAIKDSIYESEFDLQSKFAKMQYDDQQEKEKLLNLEKETIRKEAQLVKETQQKVLLLSVLGLLLVGGSSYYFVLRQRHQKEKLQEVYHTEKRISQNLHDGLGNSIFGLMAKLQNEKTKNEELLNGLEKIYLSTRTISHENAAIAVDDFENELKNLINSYQYDGTTIITKGISKIDWPKFEDSKCIVIHRAINELLVNMKKHSQASLVSLQFETNKSGLRLSYSDNGIGFETTKPWGIGLKNTENRIRAVGGHFKFESVGTNGVKATITVPS